MIARVLILAGVPAAASGSVEVASVASILVALGTATAGIVAYLRLRTERTKIIAEVSRNARDELREELRTAWQAVDRLRARERALERRVGELEAERDGLLERVSHCERVIRDAGLAI